VRRAQPPLARVFAFLGGSRRRLTAAHSYAADAAGWVAVDPATTQSTKFANVFSLGDASSLPNSKTAAAISSQAPVLVDNLRALHDGAQLPAKYDGYASCPLLTGHNELMCVAASSPSLGCSAPKGALALVLDLDGGADAAPLLARRLAEFKYGGVPKEVRLPSRLAFPAPVRADGLSLSRTQTFAPILGSQDKPNRLYYHLKKDLFPRVYWSSFLNVRRTLSLVSPHKLALDAEIAGAIVC